MRITKGYKGFNLFLQGYNNFQYEVGKTYSTTEWPRLGIDGFHFCQTLMDCFEYYRPEDYCRYCEVEAYGEVVADPNFVMHAASAIKIIRELEPKEVREIITAEYHNF